MIRTRLCTSTLNEKNARPIVDALFWHEITLRAAVLSFVRSFQIDDSKSKNTDRIVALGEYGCLENRIQLMSRMVKTKEQLHETKMQLKSSLIMIRLRALKWFTIYEETANRTEAMKKHHDNTELFFNYLSYDQKARQITALSSSWTTQWNLYFLKTETAEAESKEFWGWLVSLVSQDSGPLSRILFSLEYLYLLLEMWTRSSK